VKAVKDEISALAREEKTLQSELDGKDYKVIKASEAGEVLAETDPELHARRQWCRNRINEIRARLAELETGAAA
jgi:chromosome segregation ATPase